MSCPLSALRETSVRIVGAEDEQADETEIDADDGAALATHEAEQGAAATINSTGEQLTDIDVDPGDDEVDTFLPDDMEDNVTGILGRVGDENEEGWDSAASPFCGA